MTLELYDCQLKFNRGRPSMEWYRIWIDAWDKDLAKRMKVINAKEISFSDRGGKSIPDEIFEKGWAWGLCKQCREEPLF